MNVAVVALGKMGLTLAAHYAACGHRVIGCDIDETVVSAVNNGDCPVVGEARLAETLRDVVGASRLRATTDVTAGVAEADVVVMIPPLAVRNGDIDYSAIDAATRAVASGVRAGVLVVYETTVAVGDTRNRFTPVLETESGLRVGRDLFVAFSPERVYMGRIFDDLAAYPKIVGGVDDESGSRAADFYRTVILAEVVLVESAETAEFVKLAETTYRDVNIALANDLASAAVRVGVDALQAFELANTQPFSHLHSPGAGVGGHCIPVYPQLLMRSAPGLRIPPLAREVNDSMPGTLVRELAEELGDLAGRRVVVMGLSYRADVKEATLSPAWRVVSALMERGADVAVCDPFFSADELAATGARPLETPGAPADATVFVTKHSAFRDGDYTNGGVVIDGRPEGWPVPVAPGQRVWVAGRGWLAAGASYESAQSRYAGSSPISSPGSLSLP